MSGWVQSSESNPVHSRIGRLGRAVLEESEAKVVARLIFLNKFSTCKNIKETTLYNTFKSVCKKSINPIELIPDQKLLIQAFIFWAKDKTWAKPCFSPDEASADLLEKTTDQDKFLAKSALFSHQGAKPDRITSSERHMNA